MDTTGFDGAITTTSASAMASRTPGAGTASPAPAKRTPEMATSWLRRTKYSWKPISGPEASVTRVSTGWSLAGRTPLRGCPWRSRVVRNRWVPMSRSPRLNQASIPSALSSSSAFQVSSARPQPRSGSMAPDSV